MSLLILERIKEVFLVELVFEVGLSNGMGLRIFNMWRRICLLFMFEFRFFKWRNL